MTSEYPSKHDLAAPADSAALGSDSQNMTPSSQTTAPARKNQKAADAFRTISEVAKALDVQQHVLRFWETKFSYVKPLKRGGGRRYYRPEDFALLKAIHHMLYTEGYTIKGVQKLLREKGKNGVISMSNAENDDNQTTDTTQSAAAMQPVLAQRPQTLLTTPKTDPFSTSTPSLKTSELNAQQKKILRTVLQELKDIKGLIRPSS